jgi:hypothetical protein
MSQEAPDIGEWGGVSFRKRRQTGLKGSLSILLVAAGGFIAASDFESAKAIITIGA